MLWCLKRRRKSAKKGVSTKDPVSTAQLKVSTDKPKVSTDKISEGTNKPKVSIDKDDEGTAEPKDGNSDESATPTMTSIPTPTVFGDDQTIAQVLITMSQKQDLMLDKILAEKLQEEEREKFAIEQRAKFLHDTIAAQRRILAQQRSEAIRNKLPIRN
ncbi:hypothetical protein Tco_0763897 [Tanacetum coccineum]